MLVFAVPLGLEYRRSCLKPRGSVAEKWRNKAKRSHFVVFFDALKKALLRTTPLPHFQTRL